MAEQNIETLGILEQNLSSLVMQRQTFQKQILDIENAISELKNTKDAYEIVGTIMIKKDSSTLSKELKEKKESLSIKIASVQKQEESVREQLKKVQESVMSNLQGEAK